MASREIVKRDSADSIKAAVRTAYPANGSLNLDSLLGGDSVNLSRSFRQLDRTNDLKGCACGFVELSPLVNQATVSFQSEL